MGTVLDDYVVFQWAFCGELGGLVHLESFGRWIGLDGDFWDALLTSIIVNSQVNQWIYCLSLRGYYIQTEIRTN